MEWLRKAGLKKSFFVLTFLCLLVSLALVALVWFICVKIQSQIPSDGLSYRLDGMIKIGRASCRERVSVKV